MLPALQSPYYLSGVGRPVHQPASPGRTLGSSYQRRAIRLLAGPDPHRLAVSRFRQCRSSDMIARIRSRQCGCAGRVRRTLARVRCWRWSLNGTAAGAAERSVVPARDAPARREVDLQTWASPQRRTLPPGGSWRRSPAWRPFGAANACHRRTRMGQCRAGPAVPPKGLCGRPTSLPVHLWHTGPDRADGGPPAPHRTGSRARRCLR